MQVWFGLLPLPPTILLDFFLHEPLTNHSTVANSTDYVKSKQIFYGKLAGLLGATQHVEEAAVDS